MPLSIQKIFVSPLKYYVLVLIILVAASIGFCSDIIYPDEMRAFMQSIWDNNLDIKVIREELKQAEYAEAEKWSVYDPYIQAGMQKTDVDDDALDLSSSISQKIFTGATLGLEMDTGYDSSNPDDYSGSLSVSVDQPLLKGAGDLATEYQARSARIEYQKALIRYRDEINTIAYDAVSTYLDYVLKQQYLEVYQQNLELALSLVKEMERKKELSIVTETDVLEAQINALDIQVDLDQINNDLAGLYADLLQLTGGTDISISVRDIGFLSNGLAELNQEKIISEHAEVRIKKLENKKTQLLLAYYHNQAIPDLDLTASLTRTGADDTFSGAYDFDQSAVSVGLSTGFYFFNSGAANLVNQQQTRVKAAQYTLQIIQEDTAQSVAELFRDLDLYESRIQLKQKSVELLNRKAEIETRKHELGMLTLTELLDTRQDLLDARLAAISAQITYVQTYFNLLNLGGQLGQLFDQDLQDTEG